MLSDFVFQKMNEYDCILLSDWILEYYNMGDE